MLKNSLERGLQNAQACLQPPFNDAFCVRQYSKMPNDVRKKMLIVIYTVYLHAEK